MGIWPHPVGLQSLLRTLRRERNVRVVHFKVLQVDPRFLRQGGKEGGGRVGTADCEGLDFVVLWKKERGEGGREKRGEDD